MPGTKTQAAVTNRAYQVLSVTDLSAGLDLRSTPTLMRPNRARDLQNFSLEEPGALVVRLGYKAFSSVTLGSGRAQGGARVYLNTALPNVASTAFTVLGWQGGIYLVTDSGGWSSTTPQLSNLSTANYIDFPFDRDLVGAYDGSTTPWKSTNGSSWTKLGIDVSTQISTAAIASGGSLAGATEFEFGYTYKDRDLAHESNGSTALSTITTVTTGAVSLQLKNSTESQVDAIVVYARNKTAGETVRRKISSAAQSTAASSTIVVTSSAWTSNDEEPSDHNLPPAFAFGVVWKNRWWGRHATRKNRLHFSQLFQPQSWPALFYIDIPFDLGDEIRGLKAVGDALLVCGATRIFVIVGQTSLDFEVRPTLDSQDGAFGPQAMAVIENGFVHAGASGVYIFDGSADRLLSFDIEPGWKDLVQNATVANLQNVAVSYNSLLKEVRIAVPRRYPTADFGEWVLDLNRTRQQESPAWTATDRTIGGYIHWGGPEANNGNRGRLFSWHSTGARLFEESVNSAGNSSNLSAQYEGPGLTLGLFRGRWIDNRIEYEPTNGSFNVESVIDWVSQGSQTVSMAGAGAVYDTSVYGTAAYPGANRRQAYVTLPLAAEGRAYVQKLSYAGTDRFRWFSYHPGVRPESKSRSFSE